ncbi:hypothetical protein VFPPC_17870 [Pochonia chlamydosporia 170]|uniref:Secreted protein n=1 Tax=Pochonia chlamydosporia 170 TaxID=1380566 RepID=A0A219AQ64_METCM|nr:hypothetical protein VFPPC_17870 [Pochonia chlamydosporia 170]OWT42937.1 hypothetical protein VFPPC_17870 [Pochonia chlamydosporia 170]
MELVLVLVLVLPRTREPAASSSSNKRTVFSLCKVAARSIDKVKSRRSAPRQSKEPCIVNRRCNAPLKPNTQHQPMNCRQVESRKGATMKQQLIRSNNGQQVAEVKSGQLD